MAPSKFHWSSDSVALIDDIHIALREMLAPERYSDSQLKRLLIARGLKIEERSFGGQQCQAYIGVTVVGAISPDYRSDNEGDNEGA